MPYIVRVETGGATRYLRAGLEVDRADATVWDRHHNADYIAYHYENEQRAAGRPVTCSVEVIEAGRE